MTEGDDNVHDRLAVSTHIQSDKNDGISCEVGIRYPTPIPSCLAKRISSLLLSKTIKARTCCIACYIFCCIASYSKLYIYCIASYIFCCIASGVHWLMQGDSDLQRSCHHHTGKESLDSDINLSVEGSGAFGSTSCRSYCTAYPILRWLPIRVTPNDMM